MLTPPPQHAPDSVQNASNSPFAAAGEPGACAGRRHDGNDMSSTSKNPPAPAGPLDPAALARLRELDPDGSNKLFERVVAAYVKSLERLLPELAQARGPVLNLAGVRHVSHTLKSSSASLGALSLAQRCAEIETMARNGSGDGMDALLDAMLGEVEQVRQALLALLPHTP